MANTVEFILYVRDQKRSKEFYAEVLNSTPLIDVPGMTEFMLSDNCKLGLMPESGIAKIIVPKTPHPSEGNGIPRCELYLYTDNIENSYKRLIEIGANEISPVMNRDWGDKVCYFSDPDGHIIAFAQKINT